MEGEILYNRVNPSRLAWLVLLASLVVSIAAWGKASKALDWASFGLLVLGFGAMTWGSGCAGRREDGFPRRTCTSHSSSSAGASASSR